MTSRGVAEELDNVGEAVKWMLSGGNPQQVSWENVAVSLSVTRKQQAELVEALDELLAASDWEPSEPMTPEANARIAAAQGKAQNALARARGGK